MPKDLYLKPDVTSEVLEPGALAQTGSGGGGVEPSGSGPIDVLWPLFGICCN